MDAERLRFLINDMTSENWREMKASCLLELAREEVSPEGIVPPPPTVEKTAPKIVTQLKKKPHSTGWHPHR